MTHFSDDFLFDEEARTTARQSELFEETVLSDHVNVLRKSEIGAFLWSYGEAKEITYQLNMLFSNTIDAKYIHSTNPKIPGFLEYGTMTNAAILGHELRHAWQHTSDIQSKVLPTSIEEYIMLHHFMEADARAIEFAMTIQIVSSMGLENNYARHLFAAMDHGHKVILECDLNKFNEVSSKPALFKQATRQAFDDWMTAAPRLPTYDVEIEKNINAYLAEQQSAMDSFLPRRFCADKITFKSHGIRPSFIDSVVDNIGSLCNKNDNYLKESKGLDFSDPFYTRSFNYRLENIVSKFRSNPPKRKWSLHL